MATTRSSFALAEVKWNLVAGAGGLFRLPWAVGQAVAMDMILSGEPIDAQRAYQLGLVGTLVEADVLEAALQRAEVIAGNGPLAVSASRRVANRAFSLSGDELWAESGKAVDTIMNSADLSAGLAAWTTKKPAKFSGS